jgi:hypothetical protein
MGHAQPEQRKDEPTRSAKREEDEEKRPKRRLRWLRDVEVKRSVNAAVQDADFDR